MKKKICSYCAIFILCSCVAGHIVRTKNGYLIAKNEKFRLRNQFRLSDTTILSTESVYRESCYKVAWLKFYPDGKVIYGAPTTMGTTLKDTTFDLAGFYKLDGRNIVTELSYGFTGNDWTILVSRGRIAGDTIIFYKDQLGWSGRNWHQLSNIRSLTGDKCYFIKSSMQSLLPPDW